MEIKSEDLLQFMIELASEAGELILNYRNEGRLNTESKSPRDLVTKADLDCERLLASRIQARFPEDLILAEESLSKVNYFRDSPQRLWVIDPIDGTTNFARGHNHACISIGVCSNWKVEAGVVYSPFQQELFTAISGGGAFLNGNKIQPSTVKVLQDALIITGRPKDLKDTSEYLEMLSSIIYSCHDFRRIGSAALDICWVACGRAEAFFESLHPWDIAAACLVAKEAGAIRKHLRVPPASYELPIEIYPRDLVVTAPGIADDFFNLIKPLGN